LKLPGMGRATIKENDGWGEFKYDIFDISMYFQHNLKKNK
jgi:hypothetical protein